MSSYKVVTKNQHNETVVVLVVNVESEEQARYVLQEEWPELDISYLYRVYGQTFIVG